MTIAEMKHSTELLLTPDDVGTALGISPQGIRSQAQADPAKLGFRVIVVGTRVRIPRRPLLEWLGEE